MQECQKQLINAQGKHGNTISLFNIEKQNSGTLSITSKTGEIYHANYHLYLNTNNCMIKVISITNNQKIPQINKLVFDEFSYENGRVVKYSNPIDVRLEDFLLLLKEDKLHLEPA